MAAAESMLHVAAADLDAAGVQWALIGGLAVAFRATPRFTKDLDFAVAVAGDGEAEDVVHRLRSRGYRPVQVLEQDYVERISGVRLASALGRGDVVVDLLFASSGIEREIVAAAGPAIGPTIATRATAQRWAERKAREMKRQKGAGDA